MKKQQNGLHSNESTGTKGESKLKEILKERWQKCPAEMGDGIVIHNNKEYYYELKSTSKGISENIHLNQVRAIKCIPLIIYSQKDDLWSVITPDKIMIAAKNKKRGQHSELFIESCQISSKKLELKILKNEELIQALEEVFQEMESDRMKKLIERSLAIKNKIKMFNDQLKREIEEVLDES